jgi:hypothetical protein
LRPLKEFYGYTLAKYFGPLALKTVRQKMIEKGRYRTNINKIVNRIKFMFKWAVKNELEKPNVYLGLQAIPDLKYVRNY